MDMERVCREWALTRLYAVSAQMRPTKPVANMELSEYYHYFGVLFALDKVQEELNK